MRERDRERQLYRGAGLTGHVEARGYAYRNGVGVRRRRENVLSYILLMYVSVQVQNVLYVCVRASASPHVRCVLACDIVCILSGFSRGIHDKHSNQRE